MIKTYPVLGLSVAATTKEEATEQIIAWAKEADRAYAIEAADCHVVTRARHEESYGKVMAKFDLICPDGMPLVWTINRQVPDGEKLDERVSGADLMLEVIEQTAGDDSMGHFLLGGSEEVLATLQEKLIEKCPEARIAAVYSPPFGEWPEDEFERICAKIRESGAKFVWVGLGCPKQEKWIGENKENLPSGCYFGIGAAFAFHAGSVQRAPDFFKNNGLEWLYRLCKEPRRLFKRYFTYNSLFVWYSLREKVLKS